MNEGGFQVGPGSLFPAMHRMEGSGWLAASWGDSEDYRRAKFYSLTEDGRSQLGHESERWQRISVAIAFALKTT